MPSPTDRNRPPGVSSAAGAPCGAFTIDDACRRLGNIGRTTLYGLIADGKLEAVKLGSRTLITTASIDALLASLPRLTAKGAQGRECDGP